LEEKSTNLINNLKEREEKFLHSFKKTENINEKQTSDCLEKLSEQMTTSLDYGKYLDTIMSKKLSSIVKYLKETKDKFLNQPSLEILKKKESTFVSLSDCVHKIKIKNSMCEFSSSPFSLSCLFELIFDFIPQDHENFIILRQISKEVQSVVFDKWTCITNVMPLKCYSNCKNITKLILRIGDDDNKIKLQFLPVYFNLFKIKDCVLSFKLDGIYFLLSSNADENEKLFSHITQIMSNQGNLESLTLVSFKNLKLNQFVELVNSGIKTLKLDDCSTDISDDSQNNLSFMGTNSKLENLILTQCPKFPLLFLDFCQVNKIYSFDSLDLLIPLQIHCVIDKIFSSVEAVQDFIKELSILQKDIQSFKLYSLYDSLRLGEMMKYLRLLVEFLNENKKPKKKKI
jgi:hypothetical protein